MELVISSSSNPTLKAAVALKDRKGRQQQGRILVEGSREINRAIKGGFEPLQAFFCRETMSPEGALVLASLPQLTKLIVCTASVFAKLAMRESSDGIVVVFASKEKTMDDLARVNEGFYVVVESIEKPGNLGALIRTADGAGCSGILCVGQSVEAFNPQVIRSSLGTVFSVPVVVTNQADALKFLREQRCSLYAAALSPQSQSLWKTSFVGRCALVLGSEAFGLSDFWLNVCDAHVAIPMCGVADSLNVSVAAAVFMYEYRRQYS